ncbi:MAG: helix-turn-helix transcriptional regulator [Cytophagales bacterium]|nr:helix-turn-helix transcriptional regulator [Cytophagales bacterium]
MSFGKRLIEIRRKRKLSQEELANMLGTKGPAIGRYERGIAKPTIEVAGKIAKLLGVSVDYLIGNTDMEIEEKNLKRLLEIQKMPDDIKEKVYYFIDISIKDYVTRQAYSD